jgi:hypothetical protein
MCIRDRDHDDRGRDPEVVAHFEVIDAPTDIVAGQKVAVRLHLDGDRVSTLEAEIAGRLYGTHRVDFRSTDGDAASTSTTSDPEESDTGSGTEKAWWYRFLASASVMLPERGINPGATEFLDELREASDELRAMADQIEEAEKSGEVDRTEQLTAGADEQINENLPLVPTLSMAVFLASATDDLDARRDLQAGIEDVLQSLATGNGEDVRQAYESLQSITSSVRLPAGATPGGVDANLLTRFAR